MRARVLKIDGEQVTLGVYYQGEWLRVLARTRIPLALMSWIEGDLVFSGEGTEVTFRITDAQALEDSDEGSFRGGIDLEA